MKNLPLHPYLLTIFTLLFYYSNNITYFDLSVLVFPLILALIIVTVLIAVFLGVVRNVAVASAMATTVVFFFCTVSYAYMNFRSYQIMLAPIIGLTLPVGAFHFMIGWIVVGFAVLIACFINRSKLQRSLPLLNTVMVCCILVSLCDLGIKEYSRRRDLLSITSSIQGPLKGLALRGSNGLPDIYYIILDGCARSDILQKIYHYDNQDFRDYLKSRGFYLAKDSHSNYQMTTLSLGSSLNMNYVNAIGKVLPERSKDWLSLIALIQNNLVAQKLRSLGYKYVIFNSEWANTRGSSIADEVVNCGWHDDFQNWFLETTLWPFIDSDAQILRKEACSQRLRTFDKAADLDYIGSPKFVFLHFILPHPPFLFAADGKQIQSAPSSMRLEEFGNRHAYVEQLKFTEFKIERLIDKILSTTREKPIIILQADHGPASLNYCEEIENPSVAFLNERMSILNAYYFPDGDYSQLYESITPVNSFRVLLAKYFGAELVILPDKSYFSDYTRPYKFADVTDKLRSSK